MTEVLNGRIIIPILEVDGIARAVKSGQLVAPRAAIAVKLQRYIEDPRFSEEDRAMYAAQLDDLIVAQKRADAQEVANG